MSSTMLRAALICVWTASCHGLLHLPDVFNHSMVIQIPHPQFGILAGRIFGLAYTNETVVIEGSPGFPLQHQEVKPVASGPAYWAEPFDAPWGNWSVELPAPADTTQNYSVKVYIKENASDMKQFNDVVFGEVIVYGGQSNMELPNYMTDCHIVPMPEVADKVRIWYVHGNLSNDGIPQQTGLTGFMPKHSTVYSVWKSNNVSSQYQSQFSGIAWAHSVRLAEWFYNTTGSTPYIGAVEQAIGGTSIQSWVPNDVSDSCNKTGDLPSTGECAEKAKGWIYNGRINPLSFGFTARHALWYQGEADSGENDLMMKRGYLCLLQGLIASWRTAFNSKMPWIIIQLPGAQGSPFGNDTSSSEDTFTGWSAMQIAHEQAAMSDPLNLTRLNPIPDQGAGGLHYGHKIDVAERALNITRALVFNDTTIDVSMATLASATKSGDLAVQLSFSNANNLQLLPSYNCDVPGSSQIVNTSKGVLNYTCCSLGGIGIVKLHVQPPIVIDTRTVIEWIPTQITINSPGTMVIATGLLPAGTPATSFDVVGVSINMGGAKCVLANENGMPVPIAPNTPVGTNLAFPTD